MSGVQKSSNRFVQVAGITLVLLLLLPFILVGNKIIQAYSDLSDVRFQGEKLLTQQHTLRQELQMRQKNLPLVERNFKPLGGSKAQANAELQTRIRTLISAVGGTVEASSQINTRVNTQSDTATPLTPVSANVRWSANEDGLARFLASNTGARLNLKIDSLLIRRRQGTASLVDIRMQVSALWQNPPNAQEGSSQ